MGGFDEDILDVGSHIGVSEDLVTLIDDEEFALIKLDKFSLGQVGESARGSNDDVGAFAFVSELLLVFLDGDSSEVAADSELRLLVVAAWRLGKMYLVF